MQESKNSESTIELTDSNEVSSSTERDNHTTLGIISIIFALIGGFLSFCFLLFGLPLFLTGFIIGLWGQRISRKKTGKSNPICIAGAIINLTLFILNILVVVLFVFFYIISVSTAT